MIRNSHASSSARKRSSLTLRSWRITTYTAAAKVTPSTQSDWHDHAPSGKSHAIATYNISIPVAQLRNDSRLTVSPNGMRKKLKISVRAAKRGRKSWNPTPTKHLCTIVYSTGSPGG